MSQRDRHYFHLYQHYIASELAGGFESALWGRIILQACENTSIRWLTIAIAAVKQHERTEPGQLSNVPNHRYYAIQKYSQGLKSIRKQLSKVEEHPRFFFIAALLIFICEALLGDMKAAFKHVQSALDLINHRFDCKVMWDNCSGACAKVGLPTLMLSRITVSVESEVLQSLMRLNKPAAKSLGRNRGPHPAQNPVLSSWSNPEDYEIPETFKSLEEARHYFECIHFRAFPEHKLKQKMKATRTLPDDITAPAILLTWLLLEVPENVAVTLRDQIRCWQRAFAPLLCRSQTHPGATTFMPATILRLQVDSIGVSLCSTSSENSPFWDEPLYMARNILTEARNLVSHPEFTKSFVFDVGIIPPLWVVLVFCSDVSCKKDALGILRSIQPRVECVWDSRVVADAGEAFIELVEEGKWTGSVATIPQAKFGRRMRTLEQHPIPTTTI